MSDNIMKTYKIVESTLKRFKKDTSGTILILSGILLPVAMLTVAFTVEYTQMSQMNSKVQQSTDAALMYGASQANQLEVIGDKVVVEALLKKKVEDSVKAYLSTVPNLSYNVSKLTYDPATKLVDIEVSYEYPTAFAAFVGQEKTKGSTRAQTMLSTEEKNPLSMYLVLDKSGSMGWYGRIAALKLAVTALTTQMATEDPDKKYVRMGAIAYNHYNHSRRVNLNWNPQTVNTYTLGLWPGGGTNSSNAMKVAYQALKGEKEERAHTSKNNGSPKKFILFLTDGVNGSSRNDTDTLKYCSRAKDNENTVIYSIAFQAPSRAQAMLKSCASSNNHYFRAENANDLIASFKAIGNEASKDLAFSK